MATSVLIGNGINRVSNGDASWEKLLQSMARKNHRGKAKLNLKHKPLTLVYEEILLSAVSGDLDSDELAAKRKIAELAGQLRANRLHEDLMRLGIRHLLTTNYDYAFESAPGERVRRANLMRETKYSVFRRREVKGKYVWHIHGEADVPNSIMLGYDQYSGYLQKLRAYATSSRGAALNSPFVHGNHAFDAEDGGAVYSWLDVFLRDDIHIVGLGLDYTEIDLWWVLTYKARLRAKGVPVGMTVFHDWHLEPPDEYALAKRSLLQSLAVVVRTRDCRTGFGQAYEDFIASFGP